MSLNTIILFALTELFLCLMPGPAVLLILSQGTLHGTRKSLAGIIGVLTGNFIFFSLSAIGLGVVLSAAESLFLVVRVFGALYLCYLGIQYILKSGKSNGLEIKHIRHSSRRLFFQGLITQLSNLKAIIFFVSLYPQFIDIGSPAVVQFAVFGVISMLIEFLVLFGYAFVAEHSTKVIRNGKASVFISRLSGLFLIGAALRLVTYKLSS